MPRRSRALHDELTLNLDNNGGTRTLPMKQVRSVNYDDDDAGALAEILTKGGSIKVPAETVMTFKTG